MPIVEHVVRSIPCNSYRVASVRGTYDFVGDSVERRWKVEVPGTEEDWRIGVIVGPSGSGKTQIARKAFGVDVVDVSPKWSDGAIVENFPAAMSTSEVCDLLSRVGLGSVPTWMLPYAALSNGQRFRADMARRFAEAKDAPIVVDEFTSVVDRVVAKTTSAVIAKHVIRIGVRFVAVTCHYDVVEWLCPDWTLDMASGRLARGCLRRRPSIAVDIVECGREAWGLFKAHHYLSEDLARRARCFVAQIDGAPAAFCATVDYPNTKYGMVGRIHRVVTLPDFQGLGLALHLMREVAGVVRSPLYISTTHGPFARSLLRSGEWVCCRGRRFSTAPSKTASIRAPHRSNVLSAGFRFVGHPKATSAPCKEQDEKAVDDHAAPNKGGR